MEQKNVIYQVLDASKQDLLIVGLVLHMRLVDSKNNIENQSHATLTVTI